MKAFKGPLLGLLLLAGCPDPVPPVPVISVEIRPTIDTLFAGDTLSFTAIAKDASGAILTDTRKVSWSSSNSSVAGVSAAGLVTAIAPGGASIGAVIGGITGVAQVTVLAHVATVQLTPATSSVNIGAAVPLNVTLKDASGTTLGVRDITWSSSNVAIATVSQTGVVTGVAEGGPVTISATSENKVGTATITVVNPVISISITPATASAEVGGTTTFTAVTRDGTGAVLPGRAISWSSSNTAIATISPQGGVATGVAQGGPVTITATSEGRSATASFTVANQVATVALTPAVATVQAGRTTALSVVVRDSRGSAINGRTLRWETSNSSLATVSTDGVVTGVAAGGPVTITASVDGKSGSSQITVTPEAVTLRLATQTTQGRSGSVLNPGFAVEVVNGNGQVVTTGAYDITVQLAAASGYTGTIGGTSTKSAVSGIARFEDLRITAPGVYTFTFRTLGATPVSIVSQEMIIESTNPLFAERVTAGVAAACAIAAPKAFCWGGNTANRISPTLPGGSSSTTAFEVVIGEQIADIQRGIDDHTCVLTVARKVFCIGSNGSGKVFLPTSTGTLTAWRDVGLTASSLGLGNDHSCIVFLDGDGGCAGSNTSGRLGTGTTLSQTTPNVRVTGGFKFSVITSGWYHVCGLVTGSAYCWGESGSGRLGNNNATSDSPSPRLVDGGILFSSISAGLQHTCGIAQSDGGIYCWGLNESGRLGVGGTDARPIPTRVNAPGIRFTQVSAGEEHTCAVDTQNQAWCWGEVAFGRLGNGLSSGADFQQPTRVLGPRFRQVSAGDSYSCGITINGTVWCWGDAALGRLGTGNTLDSAVPLPVIRQ